VRKLLRELRETKSVTFLTGYAALQHDSPDGFRLAALTALVEGALAVALPGTELHAFAVRNWEELSRLEPDARGPRIPDLRFREGLALARKAGIHRAVVAIDEIDKRDAQVVQSIVMGSRSLLDTEASFILTGRYMDVFADIRSSVLAAFDHRLELQPFSREELFEILRRNLKAVRQRTEAPPTLAPFEEPTAEVIVTQCQGMPRPLNLMAYAALEELLQARGEPPPGPTRVTIEHLDRALQREGNLIYNRLGEGSRELLARIFRRTGYVSGADLGGLDPREGMPGAVRELEQLSREDALLRLEASTGPAFQLSPPVERVMAALQRRLEQLRALWDEARMQQGRTDGRKLEAFAAAFFGEAFTVHEKNVRTDTEELDLVLEASRESDPVFRKGPYLLVECKEWRAQTVNQGAVSKLATVLATRHFKQGFLITTGGFSAEALQQSWNVAQAMQVEIVLIDGNAMDAFLREVRPVRDFLVDLHRRQLLRVA
ncbi:restriction endonuclease, partial [Archangium sp.]|uniref:restriction endonuclease n=1 Tax=Archangium sp. TaxID=1872627 RepID=UPI002D707213